MIRKWMISLFVIPMVLTFVAFLGCNQNAPAPKAKSDDATVETKVSNTNADVTAALAELSEEDRRAAEAQKFCVIEQKNLLGSMGKPFKLMIEGQPVFLCCDGCKDEALKNPKATLAKIAELKRANSPAK